MVKMTPEHFDSFNGKIRLRQTIDGKRKSFYGATKKECRTKRDDYVMTVENGGSDVCKDYEYVTLSQYCEEWMKRTKFGFVTPRYYDTMEQTLALYIKKYNLGQKIFTSVTEQDFHDHYVILAKKYSVSTIKKVHSLLCQCFDYANKQGHTSVSPRGMRLPGEKVVASKVKKIEVLDDKYMFLMAEEWKRLNTSSCRINGKEGTPVYHGNNALIVCLILFTGMRLAEALGAKKSNINLENGTMIIDGQINRVIVRDSEGNSTGAKIPDEHDTKTKRGDRIFPLNRYAKEVIEELMKRTPGDYICTTEDGNVPQESNIKRTLKSMIMRIDAPVDPSHFGVHDCRHSYASFLLRHGIRPDIVAKWLGHDVVTLMKTYSHVIGAEEIKAMDIFTGDTTVQEETDKLNDMFNS